MTKRLDKTRDHGSFHPPHLGAHFEQDGYLFDHEGKFLPDHPNQKKPDGKKPVGAKAPAGDDVTTDPIAAAKEAAMRAVAEYERLAAAEAKAQATVEAPAAEVGDKPQTEDKSEAKPEGEDINLESWLRGEAKYPFGDVQKAVKDRLHKWCTSKADLVQFLVDEQKLVPAAEVGEEFKAFVQ